jgi:lambda family phage portal protein
MFEFIRKVFRPRAAYDAAATGRRLGVWRPGMVGPNEGVLRDVEQIRARARDQVRNNPWISRGIKSWEANEIGCGVTMKSAAPDETFRQEVDALWNRQAKYMDADGMLDINGMVRLAVRTRRAAGEIFIRRRPRQLSDGLPVPIQYQLLEPEFCPVSYTDLSARIYGGVQFNGIGKRTTYWMYRNHPGDGALFGGVSAYDLVPVPAASILHHYDPLRPGQIRGMPAVVQAMIKAKDFDEYDDAELFRKKTRAGHTGTITRPNWAEEDFQFDPMTGLPIQRDSAGVPITDIQPGSFISLLPGEDVRLFEGDNTGGGYKDFVRQQLLGIGAGQDVPYEFISWDFSELNDRTLRVVLAEYHRSIEQDRWLLTIPQVCVPIWQDFIDFAVMSGAVAAPADFAARREEYSAVECHPEGWPYLHELQDANADVVRLKAGLTSRKRVLSSNGEDVTEIDRERAEDAARSKQFGLSDEFAAPAPAAEQNDSSEDDQRESQYAS